MNNDKLESLARSLALLEDWRQGKGGEFSDGINQSVIGMVGTVEDFPLEVLVQFAESGGRVDLVLTRGAWSATISVEPPGKATIVDVAGPVDEAFPDEDAIAQAQAARDEDRVSDLLQLAGDIACSARFSLINNPAQSGFHWVRTDGVLEQLSNQRSWVGLTNALFAREGPRRLVIQSAAAEVLVTGGLVLHGPATFPPEPELTDAYMWTEYARSWLTQHEGIIVPPPAVKPLEDQEGMAEIAMLFRATSHSLTWLWLASSVRLEALKVIARFESIPDLDFQLSPPLDPNMASDSVRLWEWAVASTDPARREAVQQAIGLVVREPTMLQQSAARVLRTAKYLLRVAKQGAVAEALAVRRSSRQAALDAAKSVAEATRSASRSVSDRVLTQIIAAFGVVLANKSGLVDATVASWLLGGILALTIATALMAYAFEFPGASSSLEAFEQDLEIYADVLVEDDIQQVKRMRSIADARTQLRRARRLSGILLAIVLVALLVAGLATFDEPGKSERREPWPIFTTPAN